MYAAKITLTAHDGGLGPKHRNLKLTPEHRIELVGRASKSIGKGLVAANNNAWFDSPVMSRDHAQIILSDDDNVRCLQHVEDPLDH